LFECLLSADSFKNSFGTVLKRIFGVLKPTNRVALVDYRAFYEASIFEAVVLQQPKRVFQQNVPLAEYGFRR
jgi:hypothetical protein